MAKIKIIDSIPGSGKSYTIYKQIKTNFLTNPTQPQLYVCPYLNQVSRAIKNTATIDVKMVELNDYAKTNQLISHLKAGDHLSITHKLFSLLPMEHFHLLEKYTLWIDEIMPMIEDLRLAKTDIKRLMDSGEFVKEDIGKFHYNIKWNNKYEYFNNIYYEDSYDRILKDLTVLGKKILGYEGSNILETPIELLTSAKETIIATYFVESSYLDLYFKKNNIELVDITESLGIKTNTIGKIKWEKEFKKIFRKIVKNEDIEKEIKNKEKYTEEKLREKIVKEKYKIYNKSFSVFNFEGNRGKVVKQMRVQLLQRILALIPKGNPKFGVIGYKSLLDQLRKLGYDDNQLISSTSCASNNYNKIETLYLAVNINMNPNIKKMFGQYDIDLELTLFSFNTLIQSIYRTAIRNGKKITIHNCAPINRSIIEFGKEYKDNGGGIKNYKYIIYKDNISKEFNSIKRIEQYLGSKNVKRSIEHN